MSRPQSPSAKSTEHTGFPGTLQISRDTLRTQVLAVARQVHAWGFRTLAVINTHGGNIPVLVPTLREIRSLFGMRAGILASAPVAGLSAQEATFGIHAAEVETSWLMAVAGALTDPSKAVCEYPAMIGDAGEVRPIAAPALVACASLDLSKSGIIGDATQATLEKGERWIEVGASSYAAAIAELCRTAQAPPP